VENSDVDLQCSVYNLTKHI